MGGSVRRGVALSHGVLEDGMAMEARGRGIGEMGLYD